MSVCLVSLLGMPLLQHRKAAVDPFHARFDLGGVAAAMRPGDQVFVVWPVTRSIGFLTEPSGDAQGDPGDALRSLRSDLNM